MKYLSIAATEHDSNIALSDGKNVRYFKLERSSQIKHAGCDYQLAFFSETILSWGIRHKDIDAVVIITDEERVRESIVEISSNEYYKHVMIDNKHLKAIGAPIFIIDHHYAHALSHWTENINPSTSFVFDGFGNDQRTHSIFKEDKLVHFACLDHAESIGRMLGSIGKTIFKLNGLTLDQAGKLMGLKSYGQINEIFKSEFLSGLGVYDIDKIFSYEKWLEFIEENQVGENIEKVDWLRTTHEHAEHIFPEYFKQFATANDVICYSGGIAQNTVINTQIKKVFPNISVAPHCSDDGLSLGGLEFLRQLYKQPKFLRDNFPFWQDDQAPETEPSLETIDKTAQLLAEGKVVGWYQGHGEIGPRALGNRSILMDPSLADGKDRINKKVKHREPYRPFGATVLLEKASEYFDVKYPSPYMLYIMDVLDKEKFSSITHVDGTCRVQTLQREFNPLYYQLIESFEKLTGVALLLNTSLNLGGKPIAAYPENAQQLFNESDMDALVIGDQIYQK